MQRRRFLAIPSALVAACGGGGGDGGGSSSTGRYTLDFSGARIENADTSVLLGRQTILTAELVLDGEVLATVSSTTGIQNAAFIVGKIVRRNAGQSRLDFRILTQTDATAPYIVTPNGFVGIQDTQTGTFTSRNLNRGSLNSPYSGVLRAGEAISFTITIP